AAPGPRSAGGARRGGGGLGPARGGGAGGEKGWGPGPWQALAAPRRGRAGCVAGLGHGAPPIQPPVQQLGGLAARCAPQRPGPRDRLRSRPRHSRAGPPRRRLRARVRHRPLRGQAPPGGQAQRHRLPAPPPTGHGGRLRRPHDRNPALRRGRTPTPPHPPPPLPPAAPSAAPTIEALLSGAGYTTTRPETLDLAPPVVCILAINPDPARDPSPPAPDPTS